MKTLGEGDTPLVQHPNGTEIYFKLESFNPSGSFKDRGTAHLVETALNNGVENLHIVSSGNAALSLALYSRAFNLSCTCHVPDSTSTEKKQLIQALGADTKTYEGTYEEIYHEVKETPLNGINVTAGITDIPISSYKSISEEILDEGITPDNVVVPCGNGTGLAGIWQGFKEQDVKPSMIGVQIENASPIKKALETGIDHAVVEDSPDSLAEGIVASESFHSAEAVDAIQASNGEVKTVSELEIEEGFHNLLDEGILVEPTSAVIEPVVKGLNGTTVAVITGSGLKNADKLKQIESEK